MDEPIGGRRGKVWGDQFRQGTREDRCVDQESWEEETGPADRVLIHRKIGQYGERAAEV
jgi:hypothetical protein